MLTLRHKLTSSDFSDLSNCSRSYLVLVLELFLLGWPSKLADPIEAFYENCLPKPGRAPPMETTKHHSQDEAGHHPMSSSNTTTTDLFINESPMVESIRQMNLAALAAQMASLPQHPEDAGGPLHKGGEMHQHNNGGYDSTNWSKDLDSVTMWTPKTYSRPPPPIASHNRAALHGSLSLNDYSNVRPNNLRRWKVPPSFKSWNLFFVLFKFC